jgi:catechol 2,3-dioxygenase-like lactoylglutathione lyase family enzyme
MVNGVHVLIYTADPDADRAFVRDVLGFAAVDAGHGWLIFALPPAEAAFHPVGDAAGPRQHGDAMLRADVYLMCADLRATIAALAEKGVACDAIATERWGIRTAIPLPSGGRVGLYQPTHETALHLAARHVT